MIEQQFLDRIRQFLLDAGLQPPPVAIGVAEPITGGELPSIVLSLPRTRRLGGGLGERSEVVTHGALQWQAVIDLANPMLPGEDGFRLLSDDRLELILPHGGLVGSDGTEGPLGAADLQVTVDGASRTVVNAEPQPSEVRPDPLVGILRFGAPLPAAGEVRATYFLGQWERRVIRGAGLLRLSAFAADATTTANLSAAAINSLDSAAAQIAGLHYLRLKHVGTVKRPQELLPDMRERVVMYSFAFDLEVNRPDSSGGIIRRIPVIANVGG